MRTGLIADIHEDVGGLRLALETLSAESVDEVVVLGDLFEDGRRVEEVCRLLDGAGVRSVWGNHSGRGGGLSGHIP